MKLESKFDLNQKVWHIGNHPEKKWVKCETCEGTGRIHAGKKDWDCPDCCNRGGKSVMGKAKWQVGKPLTIGKIQVEVVNLETDGVFDNVGHYKEGATEQETEYMAYETGVGSGNLYGEEDLFATEEEAGAECKKRNGEGI